METLKKILTITDISGDISKNITVEGTTKSNQMFSTPIPFQL